MEEGLGRRSSGHVWKVEGMTHRSEHTRRCRTAQTELTALSSWGPPASRVQYDVYSFRQNVDVSMAASISMWILSPLVARHYISMLMPFTLHCNPTSDPSIMPSPMDIGASLGAGSARTSPAPRVPASPLPPNPSNSPATCGYARRCSFLAASAPPKLASPNIVPRPDSLQDTIHAFKYGTRPLGHFMDVKTRFKEAVAARKERRWASDNDPEQRMECLQMTAADFRELHDVTDPDTRYPSICYNAKTSMGIIQWMPSAVHEGMTQILVRKVSAAIESLDPEVGQLLTNAGSRKFTDFVGKYLGSNKEADGAFCLEDAKGNDQLISVIEVGMSESYESLVEDAKLWLEGKPNMHSVILINVDEEPKWGDPTTSWARAKLAEHGYTDLVHGVSESSFEYKDPADPSSAVTFAGQAWANRVTAAFLEKWKLDEVTKEAKVVGSRVCFLGNEEEQSSSSEVTLRLGEICGIKAADGGDREIQITREILRRTLLKVRKSEAKDRLNSMLTKRGIRKGAK